MRSRKRNTRYRAVPWLLCIVFFIVGGLAAHQLNLALGTQDSGDDSERPISESIAHPELSPERVVALQMESLRDGVSQPDKLMVCFSLASPENREQTGPLPRFAALVKQPPYDDLVSCVDYIVGDATIQDDRAVVLVSLLLADSPPKSFRFFLSKHSQEPYKDCWLTDAVALASYTDPADTSAEQVGDAPEA